MEPLYWRFEKGEKIPREVRDLWRRLLGEGKIFFYPTETIYGLGVAPYQEKWVQDLYEAKGRPETKPLPIIASSLEHAKKVWAEWNPIAERLIKAFWPGPLTIVLEANTELPEIVHAKTGKLGIRVSPHPLARLLAELSGGLIIATSANPSGDAPISDPSLIPESIKKSIAVIIDSGTILGLPSTVVDCSKGKFRILREGAISIKSLTLALEEKI
ncbi:MAG: L-threonylcarbamoyladenylate synthase [Syntrophobacterales bacterium]|nr:L-threonylcarbamoyladenylate synthase [Syntrophobacterales bacterium]